MRKVGFLIVCSALVLAGFLGYRYYYSHDDTIVLNGNVEIRDVGLAFRVSGRVASILVDEGDRVKKGQLLSSLDKDIFKVKVDYGKAQLQADEISFKNCEKEYKRSLDLFKKKSISERLCDNSKTDYQISAAKVDSSKAALTYAQIDYNDADLISPVDGTVLTRNIEVGEMISSGTVVLSIVPDEQTKIKTFAGEEVLSRIKYGDTVYVNNETSPDKKFKGHIGFISSEAEFTPKNIETKELRTSLMYRIRVILDEPVPELKQGMPVTVSYKE